MSDVWKADLATAKPGDGSAKVRGLPELSRNEIESRISEGSVIFIFRGFAIKANAWLSYHPGGEKAIMHMIGRDATDEVEALHSQETTSKMLRFKIGTVNLPWENFVPPIQGGIFRSLNDIESSESSSASSRTPSPVFDSKGTNFKKRPGHSTVKGRISSTSSQSSVDESVDDMSYLDALTREHIQLDLRKYPAVDSKTQANVISKYRELYEKILDQGLMELDRLAYSADIIRYLVLFGTCLLCLHYGYYAMSGLALGFLWHQLVFLAHDAGHIGITHNYQFDSILGMVIADFIGGLSMGWWKNNHNVHHIVTNAPEHDPDIEHMPLFAISHRLLGNLRSSYYDRIMEYDAFAKVLLRIQTWTYYPFLALGRFNLYVLSWQYLIAGKGPKKGIAAWHRWLEISGQIFFWYWFGYLMVYKSIPDAWSRFVFVLVSHVASSPLHVQIVLSHFAMSTADLGPQESFPQKMLRTTMDVDCPPWLDFIHGGLQFQVIHHLFPRMPRHNLRQAQKLVIDFCNEVGIPYAYYGFADGNRQVIGRLAEVSRQAAIFSKCQNSIMKSGDFHGHHH